MHQELRDETRRREALLDIRQALAREVSQKTRQVAGERRVGKSHGLESHISKEDA